MKYRQMVFGIMLSDSDTWTSMDDNMFTYIPYAIDVQKFVRITYQTTQFTNPRMHVYHIPQCSIQNSNVHISVQNGALGAFWDLWNWSKQYWLAEARGEVLEGGGGWLNFGDAGSFTGSWAVADMSSSGGKFYFHQDTAMKQ